MTQLVEFVTDDGGKILAEIADTAEIEHMAGNTGEIVRRASESFESAISGVKRAASALINTVRELPMPADKIELDLALKASAKAGFYLAAADANAQIKIKLTWSRSAS
jgi:hypothetical protein